MRKRRDRPATGTRIVAWFALSSLVVFALLGFAITVLRARDVRDREERAAASRAVLVANEVLGPILTSSDLTQPLTSARYDTLKRRADAIVRADPSIVRIKIWSHDGTILFSNDPAQIGQRFEPEEELVDAFGGDTASDISDLTADENAGERNLASKLFETYVPFRFRPDGNVAAAIEVYQDYSLIQAEIDRLTRTLSLSLGIGLLALYAVVLPLMVGVTRTLRRQNQQLHEQADQLSDLLEREQATVAELRELDRLKSDFVAAASHELRTPLTSIRGYVHILRESEVATDPVSAEALAAIERQSDRLFRMIGNVLREARLESGEPDNAVFLFDVHELVREVAADFHDAAERLVNDVATDLPPVASNRRRLQDVLSNLVDNALKYSPPPEPILVGARVSDDTLTMWVRDRGIGIAPEDQHRVFERFFQVDQSATRAYGGVGLGLHIVRGLVTSMGGTVDIDSRVDEGSTFTVSIPLVPLVEHDAGVAAETSRG